MDIKIKLTQKFKVQKIIFYSCIYNIAQSTYTDQLHTFFIKHGKVEFYNK